MSSDVITSERESRARGIETFVDMSFILLRQFYLSTTRRFDGPGVESLVRGIRRYGASRGAWIRDSAEGVTDGRSAANLIRNWDGGEWIIAAAKGVAEFQGDAELATIHLSGVPGAGYFQDRDGRDVLRLFWPAFLAGVAEGYDERMTVEAPLPDQLTDPWLVTFSLPAAVVERRDLLGRVVTDGDLDFDTPAQVLATTELARGMDDRVRWIRATRRTAGAIGGLQMYMSKELIDLFDASAEAVIREASYNFGVERSTAWREATLAKGLPISFRSWTAALQDRDPSEAIFTFSDKEHISDGVYEIECTYCPVAEVWAEEGHEGLRLGYMFDEENHRGLVEGYAPSGIVGWETVKSRGDRTCKFRFLIPELVTDDDPEWAREKVRMIAPK